MPPFVALLVASFAATPDSDPCRTSQERARSFAQRQQYGEALEELRVAAAACPPSAALTLELAQAQTLAGRLSDALLSVDSVLRREPRNPHALKLKGDVLYLMGRDSEAEAALKTAIVSAPTRVEPRYALGRIYYQQNRYRDAIVQFERVIALDPKNYKAYDNLALCYEGLNEDRQAVNAYLKALDLVYKDHPEYDWVYANFANLMLKQQNYQRAFDLAAEAAVRNPRSARNSFLTGKALLKLGKPELSERWLRNAIKLDANYAEPHYLLGQIYRNQGRREESQREFRAFQEISARTPRNPR